MAIQHLLSVADYHDYVAHLPPDAPVPELMNRRFVVAARPVLNHARYVRDILQTIGSYIQSNQLAGEVFPEVEVVLDTFTVVVPDIVFVAPGGLAKLAPERITGAPDFVCEITSPSAASYDAHEKFLAYLRAGVCEYWLVDPAAPSDARFTVYERIAQHPASHMPTFQLVGHDPAASRIFPGLAIDPGLL